MNKKSVLIKSLLNGETINVSNSIRLTSYSNPAREIPRSIEKPFEVKVKRTKIEEKDKHGNYTMHYNYRLYKTKENMTGIKKMREYISDNIKKYRPDRQENKVINQSDLFSELQEGK